MEKKKQKKKTLQYRNSYYFFGAFWAYYSANIFLINVQTLICLLLTQKLIFELG